MTQMQRRAPARDAAALEEAFRSLVDAYPESFVDVLARVGSISKVRQSMHILIRREQEGDTSVTELLDKFERDWKELQAMR